MPWKNSLPLEERTRFVLQLKAGVHPLAQLCREYGVSRKTAYKWWRRYRAGGLVALAEQSRRPHRGPPRMTLLWQGRLRALRRRYPRWGAGKLQARMRAQFPRSRPPALSTVSFWLRRLGLIVRRPIRARRGPVLEAVRLTRACRVNQVWTVDCKGWARTADGVRCEPLTMRDLFSRYVLAVRLLFNQSDAAVRTAMSRVFVRYGLPEIIRVDNGAPFGGKGALGLSRLSVWWLRLGIQVEFIRPFRKALPSLSYPHFGDREFEPSGGIAVEESGSFVNSKGVARIARHEDEIIFGTGLNLVADKKGPQGCKSVRPTKCAYEEVRPSLEAALRR